MGKKRKSKSEMGPALSENERAELSFFMDRLRMQDPQGPSLDNCLRSLKQALSHRQVLATALLEALSREGGEVCFRAFCELQGIVRDKRLTRIVRQAAFRFRQKGFELPQDSASVPDGSPVALVKADSYKNECWLAAGPEIHVFQYGAYVYSKHNDAYGMIVLYLGPAFSCERLGLFFDSRRSFREFVRSGADQLESPIQEIPLGHLARVIEDLAALDRIPPGQASDLTRVRKILDPHRLEDPRPFFLQLWERKDRGSLPEYDEDELMHFLLDEPKVIPSGSPYPTPAAVEAAVKEMELVKNGILDVPEHIKRERERERLMDVTRRLLPPEFCRILARHWEECALWALLNDDFSKAGRLYQLAELTGAVTDPGSSRLMGLVVELWMLIRCAFSTRDLEGRLRDLMGEGLEDGDVGNARLPSGLYLPGGLVK